MTLHRTSNMWVKIDGQRARSESYVFAHMEDRTEVAATQRWIGGRYLDAHEERAGLCALPHCEPQPHGAQHPPWLMTVLAAEVELD